MLFAMASLFLSLDQWSRLASLLLLLSTSSAQQFSDSTIAVEYPGISSTCATALNTTLQCSSILGSVSVDNAYLSADQLTAMCTDDCSQSLLDTRQTIQDGCTADTDVIVDEGIAYPATWVVDHFLYTYNTSCLKDTNTGEYCDTILQSWANTSSTLSDEQACSECVLKAAQIELESPFDYSNDSAQDFASTTSSCGATGYAVIAPTAYALNGTAAATSISSATGTTTSAAATTSSCAAEYTVKDGDDCNSIALAQNVSTFGLTHSNNLDAYCSDLPASGSQLCLPEPCDVYTVQQDDTCLTVIRNQTTDITVTQLQTWNPNINRLCGNLSRLNGTIICVSPQGGFLQVGPSTTATTTAAATTAAAPTNIQSGTNTRCAKYYTVQAGDYCSLITVQSGISLDDFYFLNPEVNSTDCSNLILGAAYCVEAVGSITTYANYSGVATANACAGPTAASTCFSDASALTDTPLIAGNATIASGKNVTATSTSAMAPQTSLPHAPDTIDGCYKYTNYAEDNSTGASSVNNCTSLSYLYHVTVSDLVAWNPSLEAGSNCILKSGYSYCVQKTSTGSSTNSTSTTSYGTCGSVTSTVVGTTSSCSCYASLYGFDGPDYTCDLLASDNGIAVSELESFNSWIDTTTNCTTGLYADLDGNDSRAVCVGTGGTVSTPTATATSTSPISVTATSSAAAPTKTDTASDCTEFYTVKSGDSCAAAEEEHDITFQQFLEWNPSIGDDCQYLEIGVAYCVSVS